MVLHLGQCGSSITTSSGPLGPHLNVSRHWSLIRTCHAPLYSLRPLPGGARTNPREGAASIWANFRFGNLLDVGKAGAATGGEQLLGVWTRKGLNAPIFFYLLSG